MHQLRTPHESFREACGQTPSALYRFTTAQVSMVPAYTDLAFAGGTTKADCTDILLIFETPIILCIHPKRLRLRGNGGIQALLIVILCDRSLRKFAVLPKKKDTAMDKSGMKDERQRKRIRNLQ